MTYMVIIAQFASSLKHHQTCSSANQIKNTNNAWTVSCFSRKASKDNIVYFLGAVEGRGGGSTCGFPILGGGGLTLSGETAYLGTFPFTTVQCKEIEIS